LSQCKINVWDQPWIEESRYKLTRSDCWIFKMILV
jgi:hypothetical protein